MPTYATQIQVEPSEVCIHFSDSSPPVWREYRGGLLEGVIGQAPHIAPVESHHEDVASALTAAFSDRHLILEPTARTGECDPLAVR